MTDQEKIEQLTVTLRGLMVAGMMVLDCSDHMKVHANCALQDHVQKASDLLYAFGR